MDMLLRWNLFVVWGACLGWRGKMPDRSVRFCYLFVEVAYFLTLTGVYGMIRRLTKPPIPTASPSCLFCCTTFFFPVWYCSILLVKLAFALSWFCFLCLELLESKSAYSLRDSIPSRVSDSRQTSGLCLLRVGENQSLRVVYFLRRTPLCGQSALLATSSIPEIVPIFFTYTWSHSTFRKLIQ